MGKWRFDRTTIFFAVVVVLYCLDLIYFLGITDTDHLPHPFRVFRLIGDTDLFRGFRSMLRQMIFLSLPSSLVGIAIAHRALLNRPLADALLRFLRLGIWLPLLLLFALPTETIAWTIAAAAVMSGCYNYLVARVLLNFQGRDVLLYVGRETILLLFFFMMLAQIELRYWPWFYVVQLSFGFQVLTIVAIFLILINWIFRSNFEAAAQTRGILLRRQIESANRSSLFGALIIAIACFVIWQAFASISFHGLSVSPSILVSPLDALKATYNLLGSGEIGNDIYVSLCEMFLGLIVCGLMTVVIVTLSMSNILRSVLVFLFPLTFVSSMMVVNSILFIPLGPGLANKLLTVGLSTFYAFFQTWWAFRNYRMIVRMVLALDDALPFAFAAMLFGEAMASTAGLGFTMIMASGTYQREKALAAFLITAGLLVSLSAGLRWIARRLYTPAPAANAITARAA